MSGKNVQESIREVSEDEPMPESSCTSISYHSAEENSEPKRSRTNWSYVKPKTKGLYFYILKKPTVDVVLQNWIEDYGRNRETAIMELLQLFVDLCNFQNFNIANYLESNEMEDIARYMESMPDSHYSKSTKYLYQYRSKQMVAKQKLIDTFLIYLIQECERYDILYDYFMINYCTTLLKSLSDSNYRGIKHTGVCISLKIITGLVKIIADIYGDITEIKRQMETGAEEGVDIKNLEIRFVDLNKHYKVLQRPMHFLYNQVFKKNLFVPDNHLYNMRQVCISEARQWIKFCPDKFLINDLIQIIIESIRDQHKYVRLTVLHVFMFILDTTHYKALIKPKLKLIMLAVCGRILDKDIGISAYAVDLLCVIDKNHKTLSTDLQIRVMIKIYCPYYELACACGRFLTQKLLQRSSNEINTLSMLIKYQALAERNHNISKELRCLLVEVVFDSLPPLSNMECYMKLFKDEHHNTYEKDILGDILYSYIYILLEGVSGRNKKKKIDERMIRKVMTDFIKFGSDLIDDCPTKQIYMIGNLMAKHAKRIKTILHPDSKCEK